MGKSESKKAFWLFICLTHRVEVGKKSGHSAGANSSAGRASALQAEGHRFDPCFAHHVEKIQCGVVVQSVRMPACHAGGRGFESRPLRQQIQGLQPSGRNPFLRS